MREDSHIRFGTTRWSLLDQIAEGGEAAERALARLSETYWPAVYAYLRRKGHNRDETAEVTQDFFAEAVFGRTLFRTADRNGGRFRSLLLTALKNHLIDRHRKRSVRLAPLHLPPETIESVEAGLGDPSLDADRAYHRAWANAALTEALRRCEAHFRELGKRDHWRAFELRVVAPASGSCEPPRYRDLLAQSSFSTAADARAAVQTVRKRMLSFISEVNAEIEDGDAEELACILNGV